MDPGMEDMEEQMPSESPERPITEESTPEDEGQTINIPKEFLQGQEFKPGDEIVLKVVTSDEEGLQVAYDKEPASEEEEGTPSADKEIDGINDGY
jgi:hypothetical protein